MQAALLYSPAPIDTNPLVLEEIAMPIPAPGEVLLKVLACGICHTDLHVVEGDLVPKQSPIIPGHQIVAEVMDSNGTSVPVGTRVGVAWIGGTDGTCWYCQHGQENLCDHPTYTGYTHHGGFAQYTTARADFLTPLPDTLDNMQAAPLLCAGIVGFRSLRIGEVKPGQRVGLFGFGASAQLNLPILQSWDCDVYVATREEQHQQQARAMGVTWVGGATEVPPVPLDAAITFAPVGDVVIAALRSLRKGGIVAINAIHLDQIPAFDYDTLLWGERQIRSVTNLVRNDAKEYLQLASKIRLTPTVTTYSLQQVHQALQSIRHDRFTLPAVIVP